jgi:membrane protein YdbS with pleckstrin-like domain
MVRSSGATAAAPSTGIVFAPGAAAPEQTLWEGRPSVALVYGKVIWLVLKVIALIIIGYLILEVGLPALGQTSADLRSLIDTNANAITWVIVVLAIIAIAPSLFALSSAIARLKNTQYKVTNQRILVERGVLSKSLEEIDMRSVDDTEFRQSLMERIFKIGDVWIVSTDKVAPKVILHGIPDPRNTRELIRATAYQASQRQLFTRST